MLNPARNDEQFTGAEGDGAVAKIDLERAANDEKELVCVLVGVPDKLPVELRELDVLTVEFGDDLRGPRLGKRSELLRQADLLGHVTPLQSSLPPLRERTQLEYASIGGQRQTKLRSPYA